MLFVLQPARACVCARILRVKCELRVAKLRVDILRIEVRSKRATTTCLRGVRLSGARGRPSVVLGIH